MFSEIKYFFSILTGRTRLKLFLLQILMTFVAVFELTTLAFVALFMRLITDTEVLSEPGFLYDIYMFVGSNNESEFLMFFGAFGIFTVFLSSLVSFATVWGLSTFSQALGAIFSSSLYSLYMSNSFTFHLNNPSSKLSSKIAQETNRLTNMVILPALNLLAKIIQILALIGAIFYMSPGNSLIMLVFLGLMYTLIYFSIVKKVKENGDSLVKLSNIRFKLLNEGFSGIKEIIVFGRRHSFYNSFFNASKSFGTALGQNLAVGQVPRYILEFFAYGGIMLIVMLSVQSSNDSGNISELLSYLAVMGFACIKLLPAIQLCYNSIVTIRANSSSWDVLKSDLKEGMALDTTSLAKDNQDIKISISNNFSIKNLSYRYGASTTDAKNVLKNLSIEFPSNKTIGIVGASGSGKSTLVDCLLGLLPPSEGSILIDGNNLSSDSSQAWMRNIGYVPQSIFLSNSSVRENIAFGLPPELIDDSKVESAAKLANCEEFIQKLQKGYYEEIGQDGNKLSGGQRQRLGIARALYSDPQIVIFDEATSALDGLSEKSVMKSIADMNHKKTVIIVAHRLATVKHCDIIHVLNDGELHESGSFNELMAKKSLFYNMASEGKL